MVKNQNSRDSYVRECPLTKKLYHRNIKRIRLLGKTDRTNNYILPLVHAVTNNLTELEYKNTIDEDLNNAENLAQLPFSTVHTG